MAAKKSTWKMGAFGTASVAVLTMALGLTAGSVAAAQDEPEMDEEIVVTGFRGSLQAAIDVKRDETSAVDVIMAEDIADGSKR